MQFWYGIPCLGFVGDSLETCCLLAIVMSIKRLSASLRCVSIMSVVVLWYVLLSSSSVLQSVM